MSMVEQGDILKINGLMYPVIVVSNNFFNESGMAIVCPILKNAIEGPLHIRININEINEKDNKNNSIPKGYVLCEQVRYVDLVSRRYSKITSLSYYDTMNISDAVMGMFDYQM